LCSMTISIQTSAQALGAGTPPVPATPLSKNNVTGEISGTAQGAVTKLQKMAQLIS